jgi:hypothetical protein
MLTLRSFDPLDGETQRGTAVSGSKPVPAIHWLGRPWCIESERGSGGASASPAQRLAMAGAESPWAANGSAVKPVSPLRRCDWRPVRGARWRAAAVPPVSPTSQPWCLTSKPRGYCTCPTCLRSRGAAPTSCSYKAPSPHTPLPFVFLILLLVSKISETGETSARSTGLFRCPPAGGT